MDLNLFGGERTSDPYARVKVRSEEYATRTQYKTVNPMFDQVRWLVAVERNPGRFRHKVRPFTTLIRLIQP